MWLFYWMCYATGSCLLSWFEWLVYLPFHVLSVYVDLYFEAQLLVIAYLVAPRTLGIARLQRMLAAKFTLMAEHFSTLALRQLQAAMHAKTPSSPPQPRKAKERPGRYRIIAPAAVTATLQPTEESITTQLSVGKAVEVLEVVQDEEGRRIRARIQEPSGWISLVNTASGKRWAAREEEEVLAGGLPEGVLAAAAAAGCDAAALLPGAGPAAGAPASAEEAWEAVALLECQLARAEDPTEAPAVRQASAVLRQMLAALTQGGNAGALAMATAMVPDVGKIWANESTREYLCGLLSAPCSQAAASSSGAEVAAASGPSAASSSTAAHP